MVAVITIPTKYQNEQNSKLASESESQTGDGMVSENPDIAATAVRIFDPISSSRWISRCSNI